VAGDPAGPPFASGRAADVYDLGDRVLRRRRDGRSSEDEAQVMQWAAEHGVPVPRVYEHAGPDLVMAKVAGPILMDELHDADSAAAAGGVLADLHCALDRVPAPVGLRSPYGEPMALLHGDLHPGNVLLADGAPMLIDWTNATAGPRGADVAETWLILGCFDPGLAVWEALRGALLDAFLARVDVSAAARWLPAVGRRRLADRNTAPHEAERITALVASRGISQG
jgi:aminoglycoside phosphotransferase (APT) family kinase protein